MPLPATSNRPALSRTAPVNAPRTWPNSSDSSSVSVERRAVDADERGRGARALIVDQADDELFPGAALAVDEDRRVERRDPRRQLQDVLHGLAAGDEVLGGGLPIDALAQQVQLAFAPLEQPLAAIEFLQACADGLAQPLDLVAEARRLEVCADRVDVRAPASASRPMAAAVPSP